YFFGIYISSAHYQIYKYLPYNVCGL
ncbi:uncharacterized protein METZ01_LOCUS102490, partial [marine metagenome]